MTRISQSKRGKVEDQGRGVGLHSADDVARRALEICRIDGRTVVTDEDRLRARAELAGETLPPTVEENAESSMQSMSRDPSDPIADRGHQTPDYVDQDEKEAVERLALEGVEEAQHEQMVQARNPEAEDDIGIESPRSSERDGGGRLR